MIRFTSVEDDATRRSAARLIREYLDYQTDAMLSRYLDSVVFMELRL